MKSTKLLRCVGDFDHVSALTKGGVLCKVYTPPGRGASGQFALDVAVKCLELYDDFFRVFSTSVTVRAHVCAVLLCAVLLCSTVTTRKTFAR